MSKILICLGFLFQLLLGSGKAEELISKSFSFPSGNYETFLTVLEGEVLEIYTWAGNYPQIVRDGVVTSFPNSNSTAYPIRIVGPALLRSPSTEGSFFLTYKKVANVSSPTSVPANAVVIPTDATGSVQIILESSTDLISWTQANPGTYGASTAKRFFRIRAVNQ